MKISKDKPQRSSAKSVLAHFIFDIGRNVRRVRKSDPVFT